MNTRKEITKACKRLGLEVVSLLYDYRITYDTGGWTLTIKDMDGCEVEYVAHSAKELIRELDEVFYAR